MSRPVEDVIDALLSASGKKSSAASDELNLLLKEFEKEHQPHKAPEHRQYIEYKTFEAILDCLIKHFSAEMICSENPPDIGIALWGIYWNIPKEEVVERMKRLYNSQS